MQAQHLAHRVRKNAPIIIEITGALNLLKPNSATKRYI